jgi:CDP-glucose 4,6-dehydratase
MTNTDGFWQDRRVLVTGCTGLLGSWVVRGLLDRGAHVVGLIRDRKRTPELHLGDPHQCIDLVEGRVEQEGLLESVLNLHAVQTVFHLAAQTSEESATPSPLSTFETNIKGTWTLLEAARHCGRPQVIVASSDQAFGETWSGANRGTFLEGQSPHDVSKACSDLLALSFHHTYGLPVCVSRCGTLYGGGDRSYSRLVPATIRAALHGQRPVVPGDGSRLRDFLYVKDAATAYLHLAESMARQGEVIGRVFTFATEFQLTEIQMVRRILHLMKVGLDPDLRAQARQRPFTAYLSADRARRLLGWKQRYELDEALEETIAWYREFFASSICGDAPPAEQCQEPAAALV